MVTEGNMQASEGGSNEHSYPAMMPKNYNNDQHGTILP